MTTFLLYRARGPADVYLLVAALDAAGVASTLRGEARVGLAGAIPVRDAAPEVWVAEHDRAAAVAVLRAFEGPALVHPEWRCARCGELNPASFQLCWQCDTERA
jgi:hypothetical protein